MSAELEVNCTTESLHFEPAARCYFEMFYPDYYLFKGGNVYYWLTYCYDSGTWPCNCPDYTPEKPCEHSIVAQKTLPPPRPPIVLQ